jgi:hypothetical protein
MNCIRPQSSSARTSTRQWTSIHNGNEGFLSDFAEVLNKSANTVDAVARGSIIRILLTFWKELRKRKRRKKELKLYSTSKLCRPTESPSFNPNVLEKLVGVNICSSALKPCRNFRHLSKEQASPRGRRDVRSLD